MKNSDEKKRKALLVFPFVIFAFMTLIFWALGGGQSEALETKQAKNGLQTTLPDAHMDDKPMDKLGYYTAAEQDSIKRENEIKSDPYYQQQQKLMSTAPAASGLMPGEQIPGYNNTAQNGNYTNNYSPGSLNAYPTGNTPEAKVYDKLNALNAVLNQQAAPNGMNPSTGIPSPTGVSSAEIDRLEQMMKSMQNGSPEGDPEMAQINGMLEKILDIQNPGRAQEKFNKAAAQNRGQVYLVSTPSHPDPVSMIPERNQRKQNSTGFFSLEDTQEAESSNSIAAVVHENQTLVSGSIVKLRLLNDIAINGVTIPKDNFIFGEAELAGERLNIKINSIRYKNNQFAVNLKVFDLDGMDGLHVPGAISRDVAKESGNSAVSGIGLPAFDQGIGAQAASAGIEFSKSLIGKKIKLIKVSLKAGYQVLLKDQQEAN